MKLHLQDEEGASWLLSPGERNLLLTLFSRPTEPRQPARLSRDSEALEARCQADLAGELEQHRVALRSRLVALLRAARPFGSAEGEGAGWLLRLTVEDREGFLQALNELRLGAWEQLGRPDPPEVPPDLADNAPDILHWWTLEIASRFQGRLLSAVDPE